MTTDGPAPFDDDDIESFSLANIDETLGLPTWDAPDITAHEEHHVVDSLAEIEPPGEPARPKSLTVRWVQDALDTPPEEPVPLIDGFLRLGEITVVGGSRALGKSWAVFNVAKLLNDGEGRLFGQLPVRRKAKVLIAQGEVSPWASWNRWKLIYSNGARPDNVAESFDRWRIRVQKRRSSGSDRETGASWSDEWMEPLLDPRLEETIVEHGFDVLVVDPWATYYGGKANDNDEAEMALSKLWEIARRHHVAVLIMLHVTGKIDSYNKEPEDLWRGATRVADSATTRVTMLPHFSEKKAASMGMPRMIARQHIDLHFLNRDSAPIEGFSVKRDPGTGMFDKWIPGSEGSPMEDEPRYTYNTVDIVLALSKEPGQVWKSERDASAALACSPHTARRALDLAVRSGRVERYSGKGGSKAYRLASADLFESTPDPDDPGPEEP